MPSSRYWRFKTIKKEKKIKKRELILFWFSFGAGFVFILWSFFASPLFEITEIKLPENSMITNSYVHKLMADSMYFDFGKNLFLLQKSQIKYNLTAAFPDITNISVKKELFHRLVIDFEKRTQIGIWCHLADDNSENNRCYYFDKKGIIFKEAPQTEGSLILKIEDLSKENISLGAQALTDKQLSFITSFNKKIIENNTFKLVKFKIKSSENRDLEAVTDQGWSVYLDQNQDPALEATNLFTVLSEIIKDKSSKLDYIDLRVPSRVFYKLK